MKNLRHTTPHDRDRSPPDPDQPANLLAFVRRFPTDEACAEYLFTLRWPDGFVCPVCGDRKVYRLSGRPGVLECSKGHQTSLTAGTVMHRTKQPLTIWFYGAYLVSTLTPGISAVQFQKQLGLTRYETAFQLLHKLRSVMVAPDREPLHGEVEVDEAFIGGEHHGGKRGRGATENKALVVVAVEVVRWNAKDPLFPDDPDAGIGRTRAGRVRMHVVPDAKAETLLPWIRDNVQRGSLIHTDGWAAYNGLPALGYEHDRVLQSHEGKSTGQYMPLVHLMISNLKRWLLGTHKGRVEEKHLQAYLNEFTFRFNRRFWRGPAFVRALGLSIAAGTRPEYLTLYGSHPEKEAWVHPNPRVAMDPAEVDRMVEVVWSSMLDLADPSMREWMRGRKAMILATVRTKIEGGARPREGHRG